MPKRYSQPTHQWVQLSLKGRGLLIDKARAVNFVRSRHHVGESYKDHPRGVAQYVRALITLNPTHRQWFDTRPASIRAWDDENVAASGWPQWSDPAHPRSSDYPLTCAFDATTVAAIQRLAPYFQLYHEEAPPLTNRMLSRWINGAYVKILQTFLEAYALDYLTPLTQPTAQMSPWKSKQDSWSLRRRNSSDDELDW